ncbi:uncharacterized protein PRCAT00003873001 [Priceomyces carsonii]|uniref:uncharacterized protein n=1 Tax=Priceomyces carsonii TaxID=28549 RepID=UPI002EDB9393|nr:unnamed protein product [Priceomyces carsonii]
MISASIPKTELSSISALASVEVVSDLDTNRYDEIELSRDLFNLIFPGGETVEDKYVLIELLGSKAFEKYNIFKIDSIDMEKTGHVVRFFNNSRFNRFNSQITIKDCHIESLIWKVIPPLERIYVLVPDTMYSILINEPKDLVRHQFSTKFLKRKVVNTGDVIRSINGEVKLCEPFDQGAIDSNTEIVFIKKENDELNDVQGTEDDYNNYSEDDDSIDRSLSELDLSTYLSDGFSEAISKRFQVNPLSKKISITQFPNKWQKEDNELFVFINSDDLMKLNFPLFNGDCAKLVTDSDEELLVKIFTFLEPNPFESGFLYLSPIISINLGLTANSTIRIKPISHPDTLLSNQIPIAQQVTISRIASSITMDKTYQQHFFSNLKYLLNNQLKCIKVGDVIPVVIDSVLSKTMFDLESDDDTVPIGNPDAIAWFQIVDIVRGNEDLTTGQYLIDSSKTKLISSGVEFIRLPKNEFHNWYSYFDLPPVFNFNKFVSLKDFSYASELRKILKTSLNAKVNTTILLNSFSRGAGKSTLVRNLSLELGLNLLELDCNEVINPGQELKTIGLLSGKIDKILNGFPENSSESVTVIYLKHIENLCVEKNVNDQNSSLYTSVSLRVAKLLNSYLSRFPSNVLVILSCNDFDKLNNNVKLTVKFKIDVSIPTESERREIFNFLFENYLNHDGSFYGDHYSIRNDVNFASLSLQSAGLNPLDLISIIRNAKKAATRRVTELSKSLKISVADLIRIGDGGSIVIIPEDCNVAINDARNQFSDSIGAPKIPNVKWEDIGGLDLVKDEILDTIDMPLKYPELFNNGLKKRSGILFYGPPGTGKTLLAKAIATNFSLNFFSVKGPELLNMYIGESEANVRKVFQRARDAKPCVIFFDELDSVAPKRGNQGDSGGVMDRIVSQLLAELDGMSSGDGDGVFVVGATNRPDLLDEALLRPGRFDKMLYLGISDTDEKQTKILEALTRKFKLDSEVDLNKVTKECSYNLTGADFYALCSDSMLNAMTRISKEIDTKLNDFNNALEEQGKEEVSIRWWFDNISTEKDTLVVVKMEDFEKAQKNLIPSVSIDELNHYLRIRENFEGGKDEAQKSAREQESK